MPAPLDTYWIACLTGHRPIYPATNDFTGFNVTQPAPFPTFALPPFYFAAYPNQTSSNVSSPNYYATYTGVRGACLRLHTSPAHVHIGLCLGLTLTLPWPVPVPASE